MVGVGRGEYLNNCCLSGLVDLGDKVVRCLASDPKKIEVKACAIDNGACTAGSFNCRIEQWMHGRVF